jgi:membrane-associated phospholipid phosphatase
MTTRCHPTWCSAARVTAGLVGVSLAVDSARRARRRRVGPTEARVFRRFNDRSNRIAVPMWVVMQSGSLGAVLVASTGVACRRGVRRGVRVGAVGVTVWSGAKAVKPLVRRGRPDEYLDGVVVRGARQRGLGYPSGHAAVALTLGLVLPAALGRAPSTGALLTASVAVAATGAARMYVGAHLPLDIVGGYALGAGAGIVGSALLRST